MAASRDSRRLLKELSDIRDQCKDPTSLVNAHMAGDDINQWKGYIKGPDGTPYENGQFVLDIQIPREYPYTAPKMKFDTRIWHPNISSCTGAICLDILQDEWSPALTIRTALLSIQALLSAPEPDDPQDAEVAAMYKKDRGEFEQTARMWTSTFAQAEEKTKEEKICKLMDMGFTLEQSQEALQKHGWDEMTALNHLLQQ
eukprot:Lankesteria_metandrocarpae@DN426_c0_g1_i1.p1